ncbi:MAG: DUF305 domain-containing protein [Microbacterium sp.]|nr:DUF305 domain-containing protein [Microbacterium sp.]MBA4347213.1 DUF305 domain-containing protein [Microbacterium sp.]
MTDSTTSASPALSRSRLIVVGALLVLVAIVGGVIIGRVTATVAAPTPTESSAEAGFARDMQVHHGQAVEMSLLIRDRSDDPEIRLLALDIATAQAQQQGQMFAWLAMWGLPQTSTEPEMEWLSRPVIDGSAGHDGHGGHTPGEPMPGVATFEQMKELENATGVEAERIFLELMIAHHQGGVEMAEAVLARSTQPQVTTLANGMVMLQSKELDYMAELLADRS